MFYYFNKTRVDEDFNANITILFSIQNTLHIVFYWDLFAIYCMHYNE